MTTPRQSPTTTRQPTASFEVRRPITALLVPSVGLTLAAQTVFLLNGWNVMPAKLFELLLLLGLATLLTARAGGATAVRHLYSGLTRWRIGVATALLVLTALPLLTVGIAATTGTLRRSDGITHVALLYVLFVVFGAVTANLWEETVWGGFVQRRLMARHGILLGSVITAAPFLVIHLPLAFEEKGWPGTPWSDALGTWAILLVAAPFFRYLIGMVLVDTGGSLLAAGLLHASFNASGALPIATGGWQYVPAMIALTTAIGLLRWRRRAARQGASAVTLR
jgi:membrane protease YdiL (CAAX protease family)